MNLHRISIQHRETGSLIDLPLVYRLGLPSSLPALSATFWLQSKMSQKASIHPTSYRNMKLVCNISTFDFGVKLHLLDRLKQLYLKLTRCAWLRVNLACHATEESPNFVSYRKQPVVRTTPLSEQPYFTLLSSYGYICRGIQVSANIGPHSNVPNWFTAHPWI